MYGVTSGGAGGAADVVFTAGGDKIDEAVGDGIGPVAGILRLQGGLQGEAGRDFLGNGHQNGLAAGTRIRVFKDAPGHGVAVLAPGGAVQGGLGLLQRLGGIICKGDILQLLIMDLAQHIAEGAVLAVELVASVCFSASV